MTARLARSLWCRYPAGLCVAALAACEAPNAYMATQGSQFEAAGVERPAQALPRLSATGALVGVTADCESQGVIIHDCDATPGYGNALETYTPSGWPELNLVAIYETPMQDDTPGFVGEAMVHVATGGPMILALSASGALHWTVTAAPDAPVEKIILVGVKPTTADGPPGVPIECHTEACGGPYVCGYSWPDDRGGCSPSELVDVVETLAGRTLTALGACYGGSDATVATCSCEPPACTAPADLLLECGSRGGAAVSDASIQSWLGEVVATADCGGPTVTHDAPEVFGASCAEAPVPTTVTFTVTDEEGNQATCASTVTVLDTTAPDVMLEPRQACLWPPDHEMVDVAGVAVSDACDPVPAVQATLRSDEHTATELGAGGEAHCPDAEFQGGALRLRAERSGTAGADNGRVYGAVGVRAVDSCGNVASADMAAGVVEGCPGVVCVPHDHNEGEACTAVDDGQFDATTCH